MPIKRSNINNAGLSDASEKDTWQEDQERLGYYYDDSHGYEVYRPEEDTDDGMPVDMTIWTIGHSTRPLDEFVQILNVNNIDLLVDVRSFPGSRKFPQFNKENLERELPQAGIEYVHIIELGGRRGVQKDSPHTVWRHLAFRGYADYMETESFRLGVAKLLDLARGRKLAIMCSEAVWWRCHRSMISDYLKVAGIKVCHILDKNKTVEHPLTAAAKVVDGKLFYGPAEN